MLGFNWRYNINLTYGCFIVLGGTENLFKTCDSNVCMYASKESSTNE